MVYLDYSATTLVDDRVIDTYSKVCKDFIGNPNSLHKLGVEAAKLISQATNQIAEILNVKSSEIIYTSGASEANNTAIKGICLKYQNRGKHIITTELEHSSVIGPISYLQGLGFDVDFVKLDDNGLVDLDDLEKLMTNDTILVSISSVNSEVGIRQDLKKIYEIVKKYPKCYFHSDVTQSIGKEKIDFSYVDLASASAQKFFGMKGIGLLIKKENIVIEPLIHGGKSTTVYRSGTPATPLIVSCSRALRLAYEDFSDKYKAVVKIHDYLISKIEKLNISINSNKYCIPNIVNISLKGIKPETMQHALEQYDIYVSTQTACSTGKYSKAVYAVTNDMDKSSHSIRISLSYKTTIAEVDYFVEVFTKLLSELNIKGE